MAIEVTVNGTSHQIRADGDTPLLWVLRDELRLTGTKFGCGIAQCGACTVHVDGSPRRSCVTPVRLVEGAAVTTIEGLEGREAEAVQKAWRDMGEDDLVGWGWDPGEGREPAPGTQAELGELARAWVDAGAACPE